MKRTDYETLAMEEIIVEMENGFLSASANVQNPDPTINNNGGINAHNVNTGFTDEANFGSGSWDETPAN
jgi:hypothetical protein